MLVYDAGGREKAGPRNGEHAWQRFDPTSPAGGSAGCCGPDGGTWWFRAGDGA